MKLFFLNTDQNAFEEGNTSYGFSLPMYEDKKLHDFNNKGFSGTDWSVSVEDLRENPILEGRYDINIPL